MLEGIELLIEPGKIKYFSETTCFAVVDACLHTTDKVHMWFELVLTAHIRSIQDRSHKIHYGCWIQSYT